MVTFFLFRVFAVGVIILVVLAFGHSGKVVSFDSGNLFTASSLLEWVAAALSVVGIGIAVWARLYLGRNWSSHPAVKEDHELVVSGPYAYVRHPIYTGVILAALGSAFTGTVFGVGAFVFVTLLFLLRIGKEERTMLELFPDHYPSYVRRTKRLVPFVW